MTNARRTPGPWRINAVWPDKTRGHTFDPHVSIVAGSDQYGTIRLADIPDVESVDCEEYANARLIAAAPDLYQALNDMLHWNGNWHRDDWLSEIAFKEANRAVDRARAIIAKIDAP